MTLSGWATAEGTAAYRERFVPVLGEEHFRAWQGLWVGSIGLGTYLGEADFQTDTLYAGALAAALQSGCNVIDTAINYRHQRSERVIGRVLAQGVGDGWFAREEVVVCTKGGYVSFDGSVPPDPRAYIKETYLDTGLAEADEIVDWNCIAPHYIEDQLARSGANLGLNCIDAYYLHNPETQLQRWDRHEFHRRMRAAFALLEAKVAAGHIRMYGTATWNGYRRPAGAREHLSLADLVRLAEEVGGKNHHFRVVQLPYSVVMPEAAAMRNQPLGNETVSLLEAAAALGVTVVTSAPLLQGRLLRGGPPALPGGAPGGLDTDAQSAIQFARCTPGVTTVLVGMRQESHLAENLRVARLPPLSGGEEARIAVDWKPVGRR